MKGDAIFASRFEEESKLGIFDGLELLLGDSMSLSKMLLKFYEDPLANIKMSRATYQQVSMTCELGKETFLRNILAEPINWV